MKKQSLIKGTVVLGLAGITARFLGLFFRWPLIMLIGDEGVGYYQMSYPLYTFFIAAASGIPVAISKMVSERNALNDTDGAVEVLKKSILLMIIMGGGFTVFMLSCSKYIVKLLRWDYRSYYSMLGIALAPFFISIMSSFRGFFQGLHNMYPSAVSEILEQIGRVVVGVSLAYFLLPYGIEYSAGGAAFGAAFGGSVGALYLFFKYKSVKNEFRVTKHKSDNKLLTKILYIAIPISLGSTIGSVMSLIDSIFVPRKLLEAGYSSRQAAILYGQLTGKAFVLVNVPLTLSIALCASIVPIIAEAFLLNRRTELTYKVNTALKLSGVIAFPCFMGLFFMSGPILSCIFPGKACGADILKYLSIAIPFIIFSQTSTALLQGTGKYIVPIINLFIGCVVKIFFTNYLVPVKGINIFGAVFGSVLGYAIACILNFRFLKKHLKIKINLYDLFLKPLFASIIMIIAVMAVYSYLISIKAGIQISCLLSIGLGAVIYLILVIVLRIFEYGYIKQRLFKR